MHKLLARQIAIAKTENGAVDVDRLIGLVSRAYQEFDRDRRRTERAMSFMVEEVGNIQRELERLVADRTEELRAREADLHAQNMRFDAALSHMSQGLVMFDGDSRLTMCNSRYAEMYRLRAEDIRPGLPLRELLELRVSAATFSGDIDQYLEGLDAAIKAGTATSQFVELDDGRTIAVVNVPIAGGGWVATHEDITERRRSEMQIAHMARHDTLTDLPNRLLLRERLAEALVRVERGQRLAVLCLGLDHFKNVNDSLGHPVGDELLRAVASRLRGCARETDTVSRLGGDEFAIIQTDVTDATDAERLAVRISEAIAVPYELEGHLVVATVSIGIAMAPIDGIEADELLKNADMALRGAKADGRAVYRFFEPRMDARMKARRALEVALRKALTNDEFELYYQPAVNLEAETVQCCEALLRWNHPEQGLILPGDFIPIAEEIGLIVQIGEWVLRRACRDATAWPDDVRVAVNLSPTQINNSLLFPTVLAALADAQLPAHRLELEITEAVLMQNTEANLRTLHGLRALGIRVAMDDFGTGYSSLSYLQRFPFDRVKIDRSFVANLGRT
ncbi:MAG: EAL domain-containing protein, partial [Xanthobacteraceae bacterium]|nr:EAL domain-containing protein [Xanthobacteraceae bacterium]